MAGEIITSTPTLCEGAAAVKTHLDTLTLSAATDHIIVSPVSGRDKCWLVCVAVRMA